MLSVVMPMYNNDRYVASAIESVLAQTYRDFRLLVCDDGSTDQSLGIARRYEQQDSRVRVLAHPNMGIANNMNDAIAQCDTEWVACMHGDDIMMPNRLERQLAFVALNPDVDLTSTLVYWIDDHDRVFGRSRCHLTDREVVKREIAANAVLAFPHPSSMFRRSVVAAVGGYRQMAFPTEDVDLWNRIADAGYGVLVQPEILLKYRVHSKSASMTRARHVMQHLRWVEACVCARRSGRPEPTIEQFKQDCHNAGVLHRLNDCRIDLGHAIYQRAVGHYATRKYHRMAPSMLAALVLRPGLLLPRILSRITGRVPVPLP